MRAWIQGNPQLVRVAAGCILVVIILAAAAGFVPVPRPGPQAAIERRVSLLEPTAVPSRLALLLVHVAGEVRRPGVYQFSEGQRVQDAIAAAGGSSEAGDPNALNLAAPLRDGQRIMVPALNPQ